LQAATASNGAFPQVVDYLVDSGISLGGLYRARRRALCFTSERSRFPYLLTIVVLTKVSINVGYITLSSLYNSGTIVNYLTLGLTT